MRLTSIVSLSAALLIAAPVAAQSTTQAGTAAASAAQTEKAAKPAEEKKICKRLEVSGTRMADRVCLTKEEWQKVEQEK